MELEYFKYEFDKHGVNRAPVWFWEIIEKDGIKVDMDTGKFYIFSESGCALVEPGDYVLKTNGNHLCKLIVEGWK